MKNLIYILMIGLLWGCSDYLDINEDPNRPREVELSSMLPNIIERSANNQYLASLDASRASYQISSYFSHFEQFRMDGAWSGIYLSALQNANNMIVQAGEQDAPHYAGVGKVLFALNLGLATSCWENVPYSEALQGTDLLTPGYDSQEDIYTALQMLLDEAIEDLSQENSVFSPGNDDLSYGGDRTLWIKAANALKARYYLHLADKDPSNIDSGLDAASNAFSSNAEDFELAYNSVNRNPYHTGIALANNTGNFTVAQSDYFIDVLTSGFEQEDPRLPFLADKGDAENYVGLNDIDPDAAANTVDFSESTYHSAEQTPITFISYAEVKMIEAELLFSRDVGASGMALNTGIVANCAKLGVDATAAQNYADAVTSELTESDIYMQKYIALFLNPEAWVDMRRAEFDTDLYQGLVVPSGEGFFDPANRALYPTDEINRNGDAVSANMKEFSVRMWRDL